MYEQETELKTLKSSGIRIISLRLCTHDVIKGVRGQFSFVRDRVQCRMSSQSVRCALRQQIGEVNGLDFSKFGEIIKAAIMLLGLITIEPSHHCRQHASVLQHSYVDGQS